MAEELLNVNVKLTSGRSIFGVVTREEMERIKKLFQKNTTSVEVNFYKTKTGLQSTVIPREQIENIDFY